MYPLNYTFSVCMYIEHVLITVPTFAYRLFIFLISTLIIFAQLKYMYMYM